ncbi:MAG: hydrogenase maturation nickel metallochaperone HypA [Clostridia bacterium]|nr:hydrogenase maturation nickel metallochaperone HypA [Clostridia bacterium]
MHELGVVFTVLDRVEEVGKENELTSVKTVVLEIGEVSAIIEDYLTDCWKWAAAKRDLTKEAELKIETIPAVTYCEDCKQTYGTVEFGKICPHCQSEHTYLVQGNEFKIKEIEAY